MTVNTIDKVFTKTEDISTFKVTAPSNTEYVLDYKNTVDEDNARLHITTETFDTIMDFSDFLNSIEISPFIDLNYELAKKYYELNGESIDPQFEDEFDFSTMTTIAEHISDALVINEETVKNIVSLFSQVSRDLQVEALCVIAQMVVKYKSTTVYDDMMRSCIDTVIEQTKNLHLK